MLLARRTAFQIDQQIADPGICVGKSWADVPLRTANLEQQNLTLIGECDGEQNKCHSGELGRQAGSL